jgi:hypothetical protein
MPQPDKPLPNYGAILSVIVVLSLLMGLLISRDRKQHAAVIPEAHTGAALAAQQKAASIANPPLQQPRVFVDSGGFSAAVTAVGQWSAETTLDEVRQIWDDVGYRQIRQIDADLAASAVPTPDASNLMVLKSMLLNYEGDPHAAYDVLDAARQNFRAQPQLAGQFLGTLTYMQGVTALRCGETDNCVMCRGESSCILPISPAAVHTNPEGSRRAIAHFQSYLQSFPDDLEVRWLLNLAHMTLGEYPHRVDPRYVIELDRFVRSEMEIGQFLDIGHQVGLDRFNTAGGGIMDDFDRDGLLDVVVTASEPTEPMAVYRNDGAGRFRDDSATAGCEGQFGGLYCIHADYDNDGFLDIFIPRGAWLDYPVRPSLLHNEGGLHFTDVTVAAGLDQAANSLCAGWADFDNDGHLDLFLGCERQPDRLYRNRGDGSFEDVTYLAALGDSLEPMTKGCAWIDYDNDDDPDLFVTRFESSASLFRNDGGGRFTDVSRTLGIDGPTKGFSCWSWDYDNDGWLDLFATCYEHTTADVIKGLTGQPHQGHSNRLFRNRQGQGFEDVTARAGLDLVFATMGSNFTDLDNDGWLDMYLGTGNPMIGTLVPNRMFLNVGGERFSEITASARTGHLQKGHSVACGDWDRDGNVDVFIQMGGAIPGDRYHNILFQNPGHDNNWLNVRLVGRQTNRSAIGARITVTTTGDKPRTVHRHVSTGSSFGANPLEQMIGLGPADDIARLEIHWPTSGTTQVFDDLAVNQMIEITEGNDEVRVLPHTPIPIAPAE